jgi:hypothetical protein
MRGKDRRWKVVALLAAGVAIGVSISATPAVGHVSGWVHNWNTHIKPRTDARYYTKPAAEARYYNVGETAANADALDGVDSTALLRDDAGVYTSTGPSNADDSKFTVVNCPAGKIPLGGGAVINGAVPVAITGSHPAGFGTGTPGNAWWATAQEYAANGTNWSLTAYVICATAA